MYRGRSTETLLNNSRFNNSYLPSSQSNTILDVTNALVTIYRYQNKYCVKSRGGGQYIGGPPKFLSGGGA